MPDDDGTPEMKPALTGQEASNWLYGRPGGPAILDGHLTAVFEVFGSDVSYRLSAPVDPRTGEPSHLFVEVDRPIDDEASQDQAIIVQARLLERAGQLRAQSGRRWPLQDVSVVLTGEPRDWAAVLRDVEGDLDSDTQ